MYGESHIYDSDINITAVVWVNGKYYYSYFHYNYDQNLEGGRSRRGWLNLDAGMVLALFSFIGLSYCEFTHNYVIIL